MGELICLYEPEPLKSDYKYVLHKKERFIINLDDYNLLSSQIKLPFEILTLILSYTEDKNIKLICKQIYYLTKTDYFQFICPWIDMPNGWIQEPTVNYKCILSIKYNNYYAFKWSIDHMANDLIGMYNTIGVLTDLRIVDLFIKTSGYGMDKKENILKFNLNGNIKNSRQAIELYKAFTNDYRFYSNLKDELSKLGFCVTTEDKELMKLAISKITEYINHSFRGQYSITWI